MKSQCLEDQEQVIQELGELDKALRQIICKLYKSEFIGKLKVESLFQDKI